MIRRTFIEILSGLLVPRPEWPSGDLPAAHPSAPNLRSRNSTLVHSPSAASRSTHSLSAHSQSTPSPSAHPPAIESRIAASWVNGTDPEWLTEWMRLPRLTLLPDDLPHIPDLDQRELAAQILRRMHSGTPFPFRYFGGSDPGTRRQVLPVMLFTTTADEDTASWEFELGPIYLLAWCQARDAPRTFRLDRMRTAALSPSKLADFPLS